MKNKSFFIFLLLFALLILPVFSVLAMTEDECKNKGGSCVSGKCTKNSLGSCDGDKSCCEVSKDVFERLGRETGLGNVDFQSSNPIIGIGYVILGFVGLVVVAVIIFGGITWMTASGNEQKVEKGKKMVIGALVGMVIIVSSYGIAKIVYETAGGGSGTPGGGGGPNDCPTAAAPSLFSVQCYDSQEDCDKYLELFGYNTGKQVRNCQCGNEWGTCSTGICCYFGDED